MVSVTSLSASAVEITTETATLEDVVAGMADPSQLGGISARAATTSAVIEDGIYYVTDAVKGAEEKEDIGVEYHIISCYPHTTQQDGNIIPIDNSLMPRRAGSLTQV